jgi:maltose alpha-D-glucosyltransferase/alpha-amylase
MVSYYFAETITPDSFLREFPSIMKAIPASYISQQRWFGSKMSTITGVELVDAAVMQTELPFYIIALIALHYEYSASELYYFPVVLRIQSELQDSSDDGPIMMINTPEEQLSMSDALRDNGYLELLFQKLLNSEAVASAKGRFLFRNTPVLLDAVEDTNHYSVETLRRLKAEQSNTSIIYNESWIMKNFRRITGGTNPDLEVPLFLTTIAHYKNIPQVAGYIEYMMEDGTRSAIASLQSFIPNEGDGWNYTLGHLDQLYRYMIGQQPHVPSPVIVNEKTQAIKLYSGSFLHDIEILGSITGELHNALASDFSVPDFSPEPITGVDVNSWVTSSQSYCSRILDGLSNQGRVFTPSVNKKIDTVLSRRSFYMKKFEGLAVLAEEAVCKTRYHNDYHLGQVLKNGSDFTIIDFEGEPARPIVERRAKHSPLKDVAGMLRSFNYARNAALFSITEIADDRRILLEATGRIWEALVRESFFNGYLYAALKEKGSAVYLPHSHDTIVDVLSVFELDKAIYELNYELNNRPSWVEIPLEYLVSLT